MEDSREVIFLLGAGASYEARIPVSRNMVEDVERFVLEKEDWKQFSNLYNYLKSSIQYGKGILGEFDYSFNIEDLLIVLEALEQRDKNIMYPHIGNWNMKLVEVAGADFKNISNFKRLIKSQISEWVKPKEGYEKANYYEGFINYQNNLAGTVKVFTLNYDLCFERTMAQYQEDLNVEVGFSNREWHYKNFDSLDSEHHGVHFALYKLHGSINWKRKNGKIIIEDDPVRDAELIFGTPYKLTSTDPYFFYSTEFRKSLLSLKTELVVCIGYSFYDDYLNKFISQAMIDDENLRVLVVTYCSEDESSEEMDRITRKLKISSNRITLFTQGAKKFMEQYLTEDYLSSLYSSNEAFD